MVLQDPSELSLSVAGPRAWHTIEHAYQLKPEEAAWIACAIDGEGSIRHGSGNNRVVVYNKDRRFIQKFAELTGSKIHFNKGNGFNRGYLYSSQVCARNKLEPLIQTILPYLIIKRDKAEAILEWYSHATAKQNRSNATRLRWTEGGKSAFGR